MTWANILLEFYYQTKTSSGQHTESDLLRFANELQKQYILDVIKVSVDKNATIQESKANGIDYSGLTISGGVTPEGYLGEYTFPIDLIKPERIDVSFDGTNFYTCDEYDIKENLCIEHSTSDIQSKFITSHPKVRYEHDSYFIRPLFTSDITDAIRIYYDMRQADMALSSDSPATIQDCHMAYPYRMAERWGIRNPDKFNQMWGVKAQEIEAKQLEHYKNRFKRKLQMRALPINYK